jgi:hypothetical protein
MLTAEKQLGGGIKCLTIGAVRAAIAGIEHRPVLEVSDEPLDRARNNAIRESDCLSDKVRSLPCIKNYPPLPVSLTAKPPAFPRS